MAWNISRLKKTTGPTSLSSNRLDILVSVLSHLPKLTASGTRTVIGSAPRKLDEVPAPCPLKQSGKKSHMRQMWQFSSGRIQAGFNQNQVIESFFFSCGHLRARLNLGLWILLQGNELLDFKPYLCKGTGAWLISLANPQILNVSNFTSENDFSHPIILISKLCSPNQR